MNNWVIGTHMSKVLLIHYMSQVSCTPWKHQKTFDFFFVYTAFVKTSYSVTLINKESMDYLKFDVIGENGRKSLLNGG